MDTKVLEPKISGKAWNISEPSQLDWLNQSQLRV